MSTYRLRGVALEELQTNVPNTKGTTGEPRARPDRHYRELLDYVDEAAPVDAERTASLRRLRA